MTKHKTVRSRFLEALLQPVSNDEVISHLTQEFYQKAKDFQIWNKLRAESKSKHVQLSVFQKVASVIKLLEEQQCKSKHMMEEKERAVLQRCGVTLMFKASEFNHDRTILLMANNPLQTADDIAGSDSPAKYLHTYALSPVQKRVPDWTNSCKLPPPKRPTTSHSPRQEKPKMGSVLPRDTVGASPHQSEARTNTCEIQLGHLDPFITTDIAGCGGAVSGIEPLTIAALMENSTAVTVTVPGQGAFRHGQATFWKVDSSYESPP